MDGVLRIVWGQVGGLALPALSTAFAEAYDGTSFAGLRAWHLGIRPDGDVHHLAGITVWNSVEDALRAFGGDLASNRALGNIGAIADLVGANFYELEATELRGATAEPAIVRVATGLLPEGRDVEVQLAMRDRLPGIDGEMTEGYLARRFVGPDVEIAFVSAWERLPSTFSLDQPLFPELADRQKSFTIRTYFAVRGGAPATVLRGNRVRSRRGPVAPGLRTQTRSQRG